MLQNFEDELYTAGRHNLDYGKLYHNIDGGYDIKVLTKVLNRIQSDTEEGIHPFVDEEEEEALDEILERTIEQRLRKKSEEKGEDEAEAEEEEIDEEAPLTLEQEILAEIDCPEEKEYTKELFKLMEEKKEREK